MDIPKGKYLGTLCKRGHEWENSGGSLRYINGNKGCVLCKKILGQSPVATARVKVYYTKNRDNILRSARKKRRAMGIKKKIKRQGNNTKASLREARRQFECRRSCNDKTSMSDRYIRSLLKVRKDEMPIGLIQSKREVLKLHRLIKEVE